MKCQKEYTGSRHGSLEYLLIVDLIIQYQDSVNLYCLMGQGSRVLQRGCGVWRCEMETDRQHHTSGLSVQVLAAEFDEYRGFKF